MQDEDETVHCKATAGSARSCVTVGSDGELTGTTSRGLVMFGEPVPPLIPAEALAALAKEDAKLAKEDAENGADGGDATSISSSISRSMPAASGGAGGG